MLNAVQERFLVDIQTIPDKIDVRAPSLPPSLSPSLPSLPSISHAAQPATYMSQ